MKSVTQHLLNKNSTIWTKKLVVLDKMFAQNAQNYPQKRVPNRVKRVSMFKCQLCIYDSCISHHNKNKFNKKSILFIKQMLT